MTSTPPPEGAVWVMQSDIDGWTSALTAANTAFVAIKAANVNIPEAAEAAMNAAVEAIEATAGTTPPAPTPSP